jgi:hypothetical protein
MVSTKILNVTGNPEYRKFEAEVNYNNLGFNKFNFNNDL